VTGFASAVRSAPPRPVLLQGGLAPRGRRTRNGPRASRQARVPVPCRAASPRASRAVRGHS